MDVYQNVWSSCEKRHLRQHGGLLSEAVLNLGLFQTEAPKLLDTHIKEVNGLLNSFKTRERGLRLLLDLVPQCAQQVVAAQGDRWFRFCTQAVTSGCGARTKVHACQVITSLLRDVASLPELQRNIVSKPAAPLVVSLAAADPAWSCAALECLYEYLKVAPGQCLPHKTNLEEHLLAYLDAPLTRPGQRDSVTLAGQAYAALPLPGVGGGNVAQSRAEARGRQLSHLLALAHSLLDILLEGTVEKESHDHTREHGLHLRALQEVAPDAIGSRLATITRLANTLKFLGEMVTCDANRAISLVPDHLLSVVFRLLQVEVAVLGKYRSQEHKLLAFCLPSLHHHCLLLLRDALLSISESVDTHFGVLGDLLVATLKSSQAQGGVEWCTTGQQTRIIAHAVLATLLQVSRGRHQPPPELVTLLLEDITPKSAQVKLQRQDKGLASLSLHKPKSKKKGYTVTTTSSSSNGPLPRPGHFSRLARVALTVVEALFTYASHSLIHKAHQHLQTSLLNVVAAVVGSSAPPDIYADPSTRAQLFQTLASVGTNPHPRSPPPYTLLIHLLQAGLTDPNTKVVSACQVALGTVSLIVANPKVIIPTEAYHQQLKCLSAQEEHEELSIVTTEENNVDETQTSESLELRLSEDEEKKTEEIDDGDEEEEEEEEEERVNGVEEEEREEDRINDMEDEKEKEEKEKAEEKEVEEEAEDKEEEKEEGKTEKEEEDSDGKLEKEEHSSKRKNEEGAKDGQQETTTSQPQPTQSTEEPKATSSPPPAKRRRNNKGGNKSGSDSGVLSVEDMLEDFVDDDPDD